MKKGFVLVCAIVLFSGFPDRADPALMRRAVQDETWKSLGPQGGDIIGMAGNPKNLNELFALVGGMPGQVLRSVNGGSSWLRTGLIRSYTFDIAVNPANPNIVYVLGEGSFYSSADQGASFIEYPLGTRRWGTRGRISVNTRNPNEIYASGTYFYDTSSSNHCCMAVFKSADGGANWTMTPFYPTSDQGLALGISVSPVNPEIVYACGYYDKPGLYSKSKVLKSINAGGSWKDITGKINSKPLFVLAHSKDVNKVYVATASRVFRSSDGGKSWSAQESPPNICGGPIALDSTHPNTLYMGNSEAKVVFKSTDGGANWKEYSKGISGYSRSVCVSGRAIFLGTTAGVYKSLTRGVSWKPSSVGIKATNIPTFALATSAPNTIYAEAFSYAYFKSINGGKTWQRLPDFYRCDKILRFGIHPANPNTIFILAGG